MVRTYDPKQVCIAVHGVPISGFADGSFISVERANDTFTKVEGLDGIVCRVRNLNKSGTITITLSQTSISNDYLQDIASDDEQIDIGGVSINITDMLGKTKVSSAYAWIRKPPIVAFGKEIGSREWVFDCDPLTMEVGSSNVTT